jgi:hypothetical protein
MSTILEPRPNRKVVLQSCLTSDELALFRDWQKARAWGYAKKAQRLGRSAAMVLREHGGEPRPKLKAAALRAARVWQEVADSCDSPVIPMAAE